MSPFKWGQNDCALFAADAIQAITGVDIADDFRGTYKSEKSAMKAIASVAGGSTLADAAAYCASKHGLEEHQYPLMAKRGDLVIVRNKDEKEIAGIVGLNGRPIAPGESGLVRFRITDVVRAWRLPDEHEWTAPKWHPNHANNRPEPTE